MSNKANWILVKRNSKVMVEKSPLKKGGYKYRLTDLRTDKVTNFANYKAYLNRFS